MSKYEHGMVRDIAKNKEAYAQYVAKHEAIWAAVPIAAYVDEQQKVSKKDYVLALIVLPVILVIYAFIGK